MFKRRAFLAGTLDSRDRRGGPISNRDSAIRSRPDAFLSRLCGQW